MGERCGYCGREHGWKTLVRGNTGKFICDDCISLCVLVLEKMSIEQRMDGLRNVMRDAIEFERAKSMIDALTLENARLGQIVDALDHVKLRRGGAIRAEHGNTKRVRPEPLRDRQGVGIIVNRPA